MKYLEIKYKASSLYKFEVNKIIFNDIEKH